jgi:hypothetical protein
LKISGVWLLWQPSCGKLPCSCISQSDSNAYFSISQKT